MIRIIVPFLLLVWSGAALILGELRWFRRPSLSNRLRPHIAGAAAGRTGTTSATNSDTSIGSDARQLLRFLRSWFSPTSERYGDRVAAMFGVAEPLGNRLLRVHANVGAAEFRSRQVARSITAGAVILMLAVVAGLPALVVALASTAASLVGFLIIEQQLAHRSEQWKRRIFLELPVVSEQLGMLLSAGYSLGQALTRIANRSDAAIAVDLSVVVGRLQQGVDESRALREWADLACVPALDRLLGVLALNREATDLGALITEEARSARSEVHRELIEQLERRAQQVWIPVTVATLIPGVLFLAVPFLEAIRLFTTS
ncbi:MAG: hypothetical protein F2520_01665 [Actinobacteria bacterium]|uniref:Unannotated protein n=1 Tax=freshwater metagenome TaxID=449393 RepID=A0A6J5YGA0_9ZZZZ|nr:hypothetical protein [Actinomycetota bacterium]MTA76950.1 hypothetical protein [Actinomycetota bacterium]